MISLILIIASFVVGGAIVTCQHIASKRKVRRVCRKCYCLISDEAKAKALYVKTNNQLRISFVFCGNCYNSHYIQPTNTVH
jgi:hypothetical protein